MKPSDTLAQHLRLDAEHAKALERLGLATIQDLLYHLPTRYEDISAIQAVENLVVGQDAIVYGKLSRLKTRKAWRSRRPIAEGQIEDGSAKIKGIWFNQPYLAKMLRDGAYVGRGTLSRISPVRIHRELYALADRCADPGEGSQVGIQTLAAFDLQGRKAVA